MDIALLSSNANQLRHALDLCAPYRSLLIVLLSLSIFMQVRQVVQAELCTVIVGNIISSFCVSVSSGGFCGIAGVTDLGHQEC